MIYDIYNTLNKGLNKHSVAVKHILLSTFMYSAVISFSAVINGPTWEIYSLLISKKQFL